MLKPGDGRQGVIDFAVQTVDEAGGKACPPLIVGLGTMAFFGVALNPGTVMITAVALGIVVDDTVHFLTKYLRARKEKDMSPEQAVKYSFNTVGAAIVITSMHSTAKGGDKLVKENSEKVINKIKKVK